MIEPSIRKLYEPCRGIANSAGLFPEGTITLRPMPSALTPTHHTRPHDMEFLVRTTRCGGRRAALRKVELENAAREHCMRPVEDVLARPWPRHTSMNMRSRKDSIVCRSSYVHPSALREIMQDRLVRDGLTYFGPH